LSPVRVSNKNKIWCQSGPDW